MGIAGYAADVEIASGLPGHEKNQHLKVTKKCILDVYSHQLHHSWWKYLNLYSFYESVPADMSFNYFVIF